MTSEPMTIHLHRVPGRTDIEVKVDDIRYFQALRHEHYPFTKIVLLAGVHIVYESVCEVQRRCLGC